MFKHNICKMPGAHFAVDLHHSFHGIDKQIQRLLAEIVKIDARRIGNLQMRKKTGERRYDLAGIPVQPDHPGIGKHLEQHREKMRMGQGFADPVLPPVKQLQMLDLKLVGPVQHQQLRRV